MSVVRCASYIYWKKPINALIAGWTWLWNIGTPPASHTEIGFNLEWDDLNYMRATYPDKLADLPTCHGWWYYSSTMRDGAKGCRWIWHADLFKHKERWLVQEHKSWERPTRIMLDDCCKTMGCGYDGLGLTGFALPIGLNDKYRWFCSEICWKVLMGIWKKVISPRRMTLKIYNLGFSEIYDY